MRPEPTSERVAAWLAESYAAGHLHTDTYELRLEEALAAADGRAAASASWDLPRSALPGRLRGVFSANRQCVRLYFDVPGLAYLDLAEAPRTWSIGRAPTNDVVLHDALVSRRHALVSARAGQCTVRDLASRHGLRRNGRPVDVAVLRPGDVLTFAGAVDAQVR